MSVEIGGFVALAGLMIGLAAWLRSDLKEIRQDVASLRKDNGELRERMAHLAGLLNGLREAIMARAA